MVGWEERRRVVEEGEYPGESESVRIRLVESPEEGGATMHSFGSQASGSNEGDDVVSPDFPRPRAASGP